MPRKEEQAYETEDDIFPDRLKKIMKERGENQTSLAKKITEQYVTIQRQTISLYMNGQSKPDTERLTAIAKALNVSADWLLGLSEERAINGDLAQACRYIGLPANPTQKLHELSMSPDAHSKALLLVIDRILNDRADDFVTWAWRSAMASCCPKISIKKPEFAEIRHNADIRLLEAANAGAEGARKTVEVPIVDYEAICTSTAVGIIRESAEKALMEFKSKFISAFQSEKSKK